MTIWLQIEYFIGTVCLSVFSRENLKFLGGKDKVLFISMNLIHITVLIKMTGKTVDSPKMS